MDFEKKYPITQQPGDFVTVQWTRGYKAVDVYYKDELIGSVQGSAKLKAGTKISTVLGTIELKLSEKPIMLNVIIDGYHSPVNVSHPAKELKKTAVFFWMILTFAVIASLMEGVYLSTELSAEVIVTLINFVIVTVYFLSAVFIRSGKPWAYYMGFSMFGLMYALSLISFLGPVTIFLIIVFLFRTGFLVVLILNMKHANSAIKHQRYGSYSDAELLDSKL
ncbi:MAG: hypothetical protein QE487_19270 [Fluviicola sp.]|nr:hypothetical protein [Fluviicola sp.]